MSRKLVEDVFRKDINGGLEDKDFIEIIKKRFPVDISNEEIKIVSKSIDNIVFVDVAFYFTKVLGIPQIMYARVYFDELEKYMRWK